ncbi:DNA helicase, partial [Tanacetum coccineum]
RNVLARSSSDSPEVGNYSNFRVVHQYDFEVFRRYSELWQRNTRATIGTLYVDVVHTTNVRNSQTISDESLSEEVADTRLPESTRIPFLEGDQNDTTSSTPFISEGSGCIGVSLLNPCKRTQRNVTSKESPSKRTRQSTPRVTNTLLVAVTRKDGEGYSSGRLEDCGHIGDSALRRSYAYTDLGDCDQQCHHCGATFWFWERLKGHSNYRRPECHLCCGGGRIYMEPNPDPPEYIKDLLQNKHFMENIRAYNQMFAMTSFGAKVDDSINRGIGPYVFKVSGQVYHWIGSLCPPAGEPPRFLQLYIYDTEHEVENRMRHFGGIDDSNLDSDSRREIDIPKFKIRLYNAEGACDYELQTSNTLGAKVFDSGVTGCTDFDVIIQEKDGPAKRISKLHKSYMSFQFPLLFIYGQAGFHTELKLRPDNDSKKERLVTMLAYHAYQLHPRVKEYNLLFRGGRLFQQYVVGVFCCIEKNRLDFIRKKQKDIHSDYLSGLYDALDRGTLFRRFGDLSEVGNPQFFITFTCNVNWPEIKRYMADYPQLSTSDRADVVCRVSSDSKIQEAQDVDRFISTELADPQVDPEGYKVISELMTHGPCGAANMSATCMKGDKCSKNFLKKYTSHTFFDDKGHVHYQRRDTSISTMKHQFSLDNSYVVPYNRDLLLAFEATCVPPIGSHIRNVYVLADYHNPTAPTWELE